MFEEKINLTKSMNKVLMIISIICIIFAISIIVFPIINNANTELFTSNGKQMKTNYASKETNTWDISATKNDKVVATLKTNGELSILGKGKMKNWTNSAMVPWNSVGNQITSVNIGEGVTNIGTYAFYYRSNITNIEIPKTVTSIGDNAFSYCSNLKNIEVDESNKNYCDVSGVLYTKDKTKIIRYPEGKTQTTYTILSSVKSIGSSAFFTCDNLKTIKMPSGLTSIGDEAFFYCDSLTNIEIPEKTTKIGKSAFFGCWGLKNVQIPNKVTKIGDYAFYNCGDLEKIVIPSNVTNIGKGAFQSCDKLKIICNSKSQARTYAQENKISYIIDDKAPTITTNINSNSKPKKEIEVEIKVKDVYAGIKEDGLKYLWSTESKDITKKQIKKELKKEDTIQIKDVTGTYYLWIYVIDNLGNEDIVKKGPFKLDVQQPTVKVSYSTKDVTNKDVTVKITSSEKIQKVQGWKLSSNGKELSKEYSSNTTKSGENITIKDLAGNESTVNVKVTNIDKNVPNLILSSTATENTIKVEVKATDEESGIETTSYKYYIKEENGTYGAANNGGESYTFTNLKSKTKYIVKVEVADKAGNVANKEIEVVTLEANKIESTKYEIDEEKMIIKGISPKTTATEIKANLESQNEYEILDLEGKKVTDAKTIGTGYKVKTSDGQEYTIIVWGDFTGDGKIGVAELARAARIASQEKNPEQKDMFILDVSGDGKVKITDLAALSRLATQ